MKAYLKRLLGLEDKTELEPRLEDLENRFRRLQEEWTEVYGKFRTLQMRVAKQVQRLDESSKEEPEPEGRDEPAASAGSGTSSLSPRMQAIQNGILTRRARGVPRKEGE
jgi:hypothetical protein